MVSVITAGSPMVGTPSCDYAINNENAQRMNMSPCDAPLVCFAVRAQPVSVADSQVITISRVQHVGVHP